MSAISPKERLISVINGKPVDRPPAICPGGMMNAAVVDIMHKTGHTLPAAHRDYRLMAQLAVDVQLHTGFENFGLPFCMTVEAEILGSEINYGSLVCEPKIQKELFSSVSRLDFRDITMLVGGERIATVIKAINILSHKNPDIPIIGNLTGPVSTAASIVDPMTFLKELRKDPQNSHQVIDYVSSFLIAYAVQMIESGANLISIADPTATGEILGPKMFAEYAVEYLNKVIDGIHACKTPVIVHICGNMNSVKHYLPTLRADVISTDAMVNLRLLKAEYPGLTTMGNLSTYLLQFGEAERIAAQTRKLVQDGIDIIAPACGLSTSTPLQNIQALTNTVISRNFNQ